VGGAKKTSAWIQHVKDYSKNNNVSYKEAMTKAKASYKKIRVNQVNECHIYLQMILFLIFRSFGSVNQNIFI